MSHTDEFKRRLRLGTACALVSTLGIVGINPAYAQDADTDEDEDVAVEEVVVTGSRIKRSNYDTSAPIIALDKQTLDDRNFTNVADLLNEVPAFGAPAASPDGAQGGFAIGQNVVNFLGLGSNRTLTVVNGRRFVTNNPPVPGGSSLSAGLQVDFNVIPIALIERIDTLMLDGAPVYGSDGIAGVINVILKDDYEGFEVSGTYGSSDQGDGKSYQIQSVFGGNFADGRGNAVISVEYNVQDGLRGIDRPEFRKNNPFARRNPATGEIRVSNADGSGRGFITQALGDFGAISIDGTFFLPTIGFGGDANGNFYEFDAAGNVIPFIVGERIPGSSAFFANGGSGSDLFDNVGQILTESERINIGGLAHYDINDSVTAFTEFVFQNSTAIESSQQDDILAGIFGPSDQGAPLFTLDNPFLNDQARGVLQAAGATTFGVNRFLGPIVGGGENSNEAFTWRVVAGFRGDFEFANRDFSWEVSANFGQSDLETQNRLINTDRLINALNVRGLTEQDLLDTNGGADLDDFFAIRNGAVVSLASSNPATAARVGDIICQGNFDQATGALPPPPVNGTGGNLFNDENRGLDGCVPLNLFGDQAAQEARDFVSDLGLDTSDTEQRVYEASLSTGNLFSLPGGDVGAGFSYINRKETGSYLPGGRLALALGQGDPSVPSSGSFETNEVGAEFIIPIIGNDMIPFVNSLTFEPKVRYVDNSIAGTDYTYHLGGRMTVFDFISFRGGYTRSIRSPGLQEIFDPVLGARGFVSDPCDSRNIDAGPDGDDPNSNRRQNCAAVGIDVDTFLSRAVNLSIAGQSSGNPDLRNEKSNSYSVGVVLQPEKWIPGLQVSADYINVTINDRISNISQNAAIAACFDSAEFPSDICNAHTRDSAGQITFFTRSFQNASFSKFEGVQMNLKYDVDVADAFALFSKDAAKSDYGQFTFRANMFRRITNIFQVTSANQIINTVGRRGQEKWSGNFDFIYGYEDFRLFWRMNFTDAIDLDVQDRDNFIFFNTDGEVITKLGDRWIHNVTLSYQLAENVTASATVNNLFERKGSITERAHLGGNPRGFDELFGRSFRFSLRTKF